MIAQPEPRVESPALTQRTVDRGGDRSAAASLQRLARIAGALYLIIIVGGFFAIGFVPAALVVAGDAAATAGNILANEQLYRSGLVAHTIILVCNVPLAIIFYDLFKVVNLRLALFAACFTLIGTAVEGANLINQFTPLMLLGSGHYLSVFNAKQLQALAYTPLDPQAIAYDIQQVFYAFSLLAVGYLVWRSTFLPRVVGLLLVIGALCYLTYSYVAFLSPETAAHLVPYIQLPSLIGEASLCLWLLLKGVNVKRWEEQASAAGVSI